MYRSHSLTHSFGLNIIHKAIGCRLSKVNCTKFIHFIDLTFIIHLWFYILVLPECTLHINGFWILLHFDCVFKSMQCISVDIHPIFGFLFVFLYLSFGLFVLWQLFDIIICGCMFWLHFVFHLSLFRSFSKLCTNRSTVRLNIVCVHAHTHASFIALIYEKRTEQTEFLIRLGFDPAQCAYINKTFLDQNTDYVEWWTHGIQRQIPKTHWTAQHSIAQLELLLL